MPDFKFRLQTVQMLYRPDPSGQDLAALVSAAQQHHDGQLTFNQLQSQVAPAQLIVLQTASGSTIVTIRPGTILMQTQYYGDFAVPTVEAAQRRRDYILAKVQSLLTLLGVAGIRPIYADTTVTARLSGSDHPYDQMVATAAEAFHLQGPLTEGQQPFDFQLRVSRRIGDNYYSNIWLQTYQEKAFTLEIVPGRPSGGSFFDWEGTLADQGLEFRYERNNKQALHAGRSESTPASIIQMITDAMNELPEALRNVTRCILPEDGHVRT